MKSQDRATYLDKLLQEQNFPSVCIHAGMNQEERIKNYSNFKNFQHRILVTTNVMGRGIDIERVNIVINFDMPEDDDTYLHRVIPWLQVGRAGRFGTKGLSITFVTEQTDKDTLQKIQDRFLFKIDELPDTINTSDYSKLLLHFSEQLIIRQFMNF